ncbi:MAG: NYN domain-containing protein [Acidobacteriota bacterium]|jgi:uncharacterized LabA/DUF88 family protein
MTERALLLIDGGYLDFLQRSLGSPRLDYGRMAETIAERLGYRLLRCVYFNCLPYQSANPAPEEQEAYKKKAGFYDRLQRLDRFEVKLGHLAFRGTDEITGKPVLEQKQVDVLLATDMVYTAARRSVDAIILLSGDGDFVPAVELVKREGLTFALVHGSRSGSQLTVHEQLWLAADVRLELDMEFLSPILRDT